MRAEKGLDAPTEEKKLDVEPAAKVAAEEHKEVKPGAEVPPPASSVPSDKPAAVPEKYVLEH